MKVFHERCPLCGQACKIIYKQTDRDIGRCISRECGLMFAISQPDDEEVQNLYTQHYYPNLDPEERTIHKPNSDEKKFHQHLEAIAKMTSLRGKSILDYGCGIGNFLEATKKYALSEAHGIELNDSARTTASGRGFIVEKNISAFADRQFDIIYMNDVIEHLRDPVASLMAVGRVLSESGLLFIITMNILGLKSRLLASRWGLIADPTHFYFFDPQSLTRTLIKAGFRKTEIKRWPVEFSHHGLMRKWSQQVLVKTGNDTGLKICAWNWHDPAVP